MFMRIKIPASFLLSTAASISTLAAVAVRSLSYATSLNFINRSNPYLIRGVSGRKRFVYRASSSISCCCNYSSNESRFRVKYFSRNRKVFRVGQVVGLSSLISSNFATDTDIMSSGKDLMNHRRKRVGPRLNDVLFKSIETMHMRGKGMDEKVSFGDLLDAGTGIHSLRWIASLLLADDDDDDNDGDDKDLLMESTSDDYNRPYITSFSAVTADETMRRNVEVEAAKLGIQVSDTSELSPSSSSIVIGNWANDVHYEAANTAQEVAAAANYLCEDQMFDTILADYLVGAMDGFSPYYQDKIFDRLKRHLKPGGRIYVVGIQPIPDKALPLGTGADLICKVRQIRDACILLARHRCYREYPQDWIERHMEKAGLTIVETKRHPILYSYPTIKKQLDVARRKLPLFPDEDLARSMRKTIDDLDEKCKAATKNNEERIQLGFDYVVCGELPSH